MPRYAQVFQDIAVQQSTADNARYLTMVVDHNCQYLQEAYKIADSFWKHFWHDSYGDHYNLAAAVTEDWSSW